MWLSGIILSDIYLNNLSSFSKKRTAGKEHPHRYDIWAACCLEVEIDVLTGQYLVSLWFRFCMFGCIFAESLVYYINFRYFVFHASWIVISWYRFSYFFPHIFNYVQILKLFVFICLLSKYSYLFEYAVNVAIFHPNTHSSWTAPSCRYRWGLREKHEPFRRHRTSGGSLCHGCWSLHVWAGEVRRGNGRKAL